ncbi:hypothetical protein HN51_002599 [Arachis hypogaea]|uniref:Di19 zinc-binding domain-containing protein n=1 Tax=Arachis hypogaea TaxID=3818 RepID=A0A445ELW6_ARAHY|nr:protein DEHYDRATION-INDUCED 19 homolog 7 [Arachis hypogaea]QHO50815.1 uncharacterized protein DS421_1g25590 [Arachis hypogaea]RYR76440.1 hypothetical protein Ahy_A01g001031 [Arachis hypogaea]
MEPDPSSLASFSSTDIQSLADLLADLVLGEQSVDDDLRPKQEFMCPFCGEIHDADSLSYHIHDQHPRHLTNGVDMTMFSLAVKIVLHSCFFPYAVQRT